MTIEQPQAAARSELALSIPRETVNAADEVIKTGSSVADRGGLNKALASFEAALPSGLEDPLNARIYGDFDTLKSAVRLAQSVTHAEPVSLLGRWLHGAAVAAVSKALESATPTNRENLDRFARSLEEGSPVIFYAAKVCVASMATDPRIDLNSSF